MFRKLSEKPHLGASNTTCWLFALLILSLVRGNFFLFGSKGEARVAWKLLTKNIVLYKM